VLKTAAADIRALAAGLRQIEAIAAELDAQQPGYEAIVSPLEMKTRHFSSYNHSLGHDVRGGARKGSPA